MTYYIYAITNKKNNKSYIGQSINAKERWKDHIYDAKRTVGKTAINKKFPIHTAIAKYSEDGFIWQIIEQCETLEEANELEEFYIGYLQTLAPNGYNLLPGGNNRRIAESTKKKISDKLKIVGSFVGKRGAAHPNFGRIVSREEKDNLSKKFSGDGSSGKKINSQIARQIYLDFLEDQTISIVKLGEKYGLKNIATTNIINKKCWKNATKDLPNINLKDRTRGEKWVLSKITEAQAIAILTDYTYNNMNGAEISRKYNISESIVYGIISRKNWKHIRV